MFVSQHFRDLSNEQGRALLANGALSFCLHNDRDDLEHAREPLGLSDTDIAQIQALPKQHGRLLDRLHGLRPRPRRRPRRARRPRVLDLLL